MQSLTLRTSRALKRLACATVLSAASSLAHAQDGEVVARVNGREITGADVAVAEQMYGPQLGQMPADARLSAIVNALIELRIVSDAAREAGVTDQDEFKSQIAFFEAQTLRSIFVEQQVAAAVSDADVRAAYDRQVASIPSVPERRLRHILVASEAQAREIIAALSSGQPFAELAQAHSLDVASKANGGDLGFMPEGQIMPEIDEAVSGLEPGEFTQDPVETAFGFHVVLLEEARDRPAPAFDAVAPQIRQSLAGAAERRVIDELRAAAEVEKLVPDVAPPQEDDGHEH